MADKSHVSSELSRDLSLFHITMMGLAVFLHEIGRTAWIVAPAWILIGVVIYNVYSKSRALATDDEIRVLEENEAQEGDEYRVMVAMANPDNALSMVRNTYAVCRAKNARVELLHMVPVPEVVAKACRKHLSWSSPPPDCSHG